MHSYNLYQLIAIFTVLPVIYMLNDLNTYQLHLLKIGLVTTFVVGIIAILYLEISIWGPRRYKKALLELEEHKKDAIKRIRQLKEDKGFSKDFDDSIKAIKEIEDPEFSIQVDDKKDNVHRIFQSFVRENTPKGKPSFFENIINNGIHAISDNVTINDVVDIGLTLF